MAKTNLTDEEKQQIIEAINSGTEPPPELMPKLFPHVAEKYDVATLDRAKIATLEYAGKRSEAAILNQTFTVEGGSPLQAERLFKEGSLSGQTQLEILDYLNKSKTDWMNLIVQGDNLQFLKTCFQNEDPLIRDKVKGKVKLVYIDPPFATKGDFQSTGGPKSYSDKVNTSEFLENLRERLVFLREILAEDGMLVVHIDYRLGHYIKVLLDEIFPGGFRNDIKVPRGTKNVQNQFEEITALTVGDDSLFLYVKSNKTKLPHLRIQLEEHAEGKWDTFWRGTDRKTMRYKLFNKKPETGQWRWKESRALQSVKNYENYLKHAAKEESLDEYYLRHFESGIDLDFVRLNEDDVVQYYVPPRDNRIASTVWTDVRTIGKQTSYPTEKHEDLLSRLVDWLSKKDDLVVDIFAGSGTTAAVAEKLGRRWIVCDFGKHAIYTMQKRILRIAESKPLGDEAGGKKKYGKGPQPFCVVSCGAYDFSRIMKLRENKDAYINFVLGLFQLPRDAKDLNGRFGLTHIYGEKDGHPVEVYPVWEDEYLKNIRIDEDYLQQILIQSGGKLRGDYYIITPETCTVIGDITLENKNGHNVHFKLMKFPYKVLEEVSRNFQITEQPSAQENVNNLINATGFYFNNEVEISVKKIKGGLKITQFKTGILDGRGEKFKDLAGLAMLLVDVDYDDNIFDMEKTVFAKDINDNQEIKISGLTGSVAVIAIDKHGNESKPFILKD